ncbi:hypothetical protein BpHYR1_036421 [Brachionus plicatilis]|uniref:Uncharacterized protein n=1 Tax=Brachionus plicatilis TaxID=10195 RepID=A0A3M7QCU9_BRAPC|nr:hypothetical protein BpHYR1_036421 [Brachionus plicatilis]
MMVNEIEEAILKKPIEENITYEKYRIGGTSPKENDKTVINFKRLEQSVMSSQDDEHHANDNTPISPPNVEVVSDTK